MNRQDYKDKLEQILVDTTKFKTITRDPTKELKVEVNTIINSINRDCKKRILEPLIGEFVPGYLYGTFKNHKIGNYPHGSEAIEKNNYPLPSHKIYA